MSNLFSNSPADIPPISSWTQYMTMALQEAKNAADHQEVPVGAVLVKD